MGIRKRLILSVAGFLVLINVAFWAFYYIAKGGLENDLDTKLVAVARLVAADLRGEFLAAIGPGDEKTRTYQNYRARLDRARDIFQLSRIMIVDSNRDLLVDADEKIAIGQPVFVLDGAESEVASAFSGTVATTVVYRGEDGNLYKSAFAPITNSTGKVAAVLAVEASAAFLSQLDVLRKVILLIMSVSIAAIIVFGLFLSWSVVNPLLKLVRATTEIKGGEYREVEPAGGLEVRYLINSFNEMASSIRENEEKLRDLYRAESKRAEDITRYAEYILENIATGIVSLDREGVVLVCNVEACRIFGIREDDVLGRNYSDLPVFSDIRGLISRSIESSEVARDRRIEYANPAGGQFQLSVSTSPLSPRPATGIAVNIVITDQTALLQLQDEVKRRETLAAIGELAAHVAHEVRNPLGSVKIYMDLMNRTATDDEKRRQYIDKVTSEITRLDAIVTEFLQYSAPSKTHVSEFVLADVIDDAVTFAQQDSGTEGFDVGGNYRDSKTLRVRADKRQFMQMFLNLLINARDATREKGGVAVDVTDNDGGGVIVEVSDTGTGIEPDKIPEVFKPFYSTKTTGTGLGLAMVLRIVENHRGGIDIRSMPGRGTTVTLTLPVAA